MMIRILFGIVTLLVGLTLVLLGFTMEYQVNFVMVGIGYLLTITGYKVIFYWWGKKKNYSYSNKTYTSAKEDPSLTKFYNRYCGECGKISQHELARFGKGSPKAYLTCGACGYWIERKW